MGVSGVTANFEVRMWQSWLMLKYVDMIYVFTILQELTKSQINKSYL